MPEPFIIDRLQWIQESVQSIKKYFKSINSAKDFNSSLGAMAYDAVLMRLQVIGENIKTIDKHSPDLFNSIQYEVSSIIRFREINSHHYKKLDTELVFEICPNYIPRFKQQIEELLTYNK